MINLEKFTYKKLSKYSYLCYIPRWGDENDFMYVVCVNSYPKCGNDDYEIYGYGKNSEEALLMAVGELASAGTKGLSLEYLKDLTLPELAKMIGENEGCLASSTKQPLANIEGQGSDLGSLSKDSTFHVSIDKDGAWPLMI